MSNRMTAYLVGNLLDWIKAKSKNDTTKKKLS